MKEDLKESLDEFYRLLLNGRVAKPTITGQDYVNMLNDLHREVFTLEHTINLAKSEPKGHLIETILTPYLLDAQKRLKSWENTRFKIID